MTDASAALALSTASLVVGVYAAALPTLTDARAQVDDDGHMAKAQQYAAMVSIAAIVGAAAVTRSAGVAVVGAIAVLGMSTAFRFAADHHPHATA